MSAAGGSVPDGFSLPRQGGIQPKSFGFASREVSVIGQGTWYIDDAHEATAISTLRRGLDLGMTHIDTAEMYGDAEVVVCEAINDWRDKVFLVSKVVPSNALQRRHRSGGSIRRPLCLYRLLHLRANERNNASKPLPDISRKLADTNLVFPVSAAGKFL